MTTPSFDDVKNLAKCEANPVVSVYIPTHPGGPDAQEDPVRFKNRLAEARRQIAALSNGPSDIPSWFEPAEELSGNAGFWRSQGDGLAMFLGRELFRVFRTALSLEELTLVGPNAHIVPLLAAMEEGTEFYVLAVSQDRIRLFRGSRSAIFDVETPGSPDGVDEMLTAERSPDQLQFRTIGSRSGGGQVALFHGHGGTDADGEEHLVKYLREVDREVGRALENKNAPLVFAGDVSLFPLYKQANSSPSLVESFIRGNPDELSSTELHAQAWPLVEEQLDARCRKTLAAVEEAVASGKGATDIAGTIGAAVRGRVETLLLGEGEHVWGRYNAPEQNVQVLPDRVADSEDLLNVAAIHTLRNGGRVLVVKPDELAFAGAVAAAYRF
jgi:hypothetical protein